MPAHGLEHNSSDIFEFDEFLSYELPSAELGNTCQIDPPQQIGASTTDTEVAPQGHGIDPSLLVQVQSTLTNRNTQLSGRGPNDYFMPGDPVVGSTTQTQFNNPFHIHQPLQSSAPPESIGNGSCLQYTHISPYQQHFGNMSNVTDHHALALNMGNESSFDYNSTARPHPFSAILSNTGSGQDCEGYFGFWPPLPDSTVSSASSHSLIPPESHQSRSSQQQILNSASNPSTLTRRLFGPLKNIKTLPPKRRGGRRGPLSISQLDQRKRAKRQGICIRCRKLRTKVSCPKVCWRQICQL